MSGTIEKHIYLIRHFDREDLQESDAMFSSMNMSYNVTYDEAVLINLSNPGISTDKEDMIVGSDKVFGDTFIKNITELQNATDSDYDKIYLRNKMNI